MGQIAGHVHFANSTNAMAALQHHTIGKNDKNTLMNTRIISRVRTEGRDLGLDPTLPYKRVCLVPWSICNRKAWYENQDQRRHSEKEYCCPDTELVSGSPLQGLF